MLLLGKKATSACNSRGTATKRVGRRSGQKGAGVNQAEETKGNGDSVNGEESIAAACRYRRDRGERPKGPARPLLGNSSCSRQEQGTKLRLGHIVPEEASEGSPRPGGKPPD